MSCVPVSEVFYSIQGEGRNTGRPAVFIRFQGCPVHCLFCDTKYTWTCNPDNQVQPHEILCEDSPVERKRGSWAMVGSDVLCGWVMAHAPQGTLVVITGGEPLESDGLAELVQDLNSHAYPVQIETSGTVPNRRLANIRTDDSRMLCITVSPKWESRMLVLTEVMRLAHEIKVVVSSAHIVDKIVSEFGPENPVAYTCTHSILCLQPETGPNFQWSLQQCVKLCKMYGWRLSLQTQALTRDSRSVDRGIHLD